MMVRDEATVTADVILRFFQCFVLHQLCLWLVCGCQNFPLAS